jgi:hypothetical protein
VGVYGHGGLAKGDVEDYVSGLSTYARKLFQCFSGIGYLTVMFVD